ncbi:hypothetical protein ARMGADRAFT_579655 [Armillaria gallica]|uniref:Uncharacterized protein n=1 Tax=Armillaria gallica TaxID=47427 RepID=A0A2H3DWT4_ARMGA|nr:hypothetical protein ARMGADRAFT_579655 [Armillaria gallica]
MVITRRAFFEPESHSKPADIEFKSVNEETASRLARVHVGIGADGRKGTDMDISQNCLIGVINSENGEANKVKNQITGEWDGVPQVGAYYRDHGIK